MLVTHTQAQGMSTQALRDQALHVLSSLPEDQLLVVIAYARSLLGDGLMRAQTHVLEDLVEEQV
jgi:uncharacterized protein HemY